MINWVGMAGPLETHRRIIVPNVVAVCQTLSAYVRHAKVWMNEWIPSPAQTGSSSSHNDDVRSTDNGQMLFLVLLDLSAAFDTADHRTLLSVLSNCFSVNGTALDWLKSYAIGRMQA